MVFRDQNKYLKLRNLNFKAFGSLTHRAGASHLEYLAPSSCCVQQNVHILCCAGEIQFL